MEATVGLMRKAFEHDMARNKRLFGITKKCPDCREDVSSKVRVCPYCRHRFEA